MSTASSLPRVVFVCVRNSGKSQMAAGLMSAAAGGRIDVDSAGTEPASGLNRLSAQVLQEVGIDITDRVPKLLTPELMAAADLVVTLGREVVVEPLGDTPVVNWDTDEPSVRGVEGIQRMRLIRDDIASRVSALAAELGSE